MAHRLPKGRTFGQALGHLAGPGYRLVEVKVGGYVAAPFRERFNPTVCPAHDVQPPVPLAAGIEIGVLAVGDGFTGTDQHWHLTLVGAVNAQGTLQQSHSGVQQNGLHLAGDPGIAHGHGHGQGLMPGVDVTGSVGLVYFLPG